MPVYGFLRWYAWGKGQVGHDLKPQPGFNVKGSVRHSSGRVNAQTFYYREGTTEEGYAWKGELTWEHVTDELGWSDLDDAITGPIFDRLRGNIGYEGQNWSDNCSTALGDKYQMDQLLQDNGLRRCCPDFRLDEIIVESFRMMIQSAPHVQTELLRSWPVSS
jgi:hypothetical protein